MPKENCKYWDKCYQKNEVHLQKYNHPEKNSKIDNENTQKKNDSHESEEHKQRREKEGNENNKVNGNDDKYETKDLREEALANIRGKDYMGMLQKRIRLSEQKEYDDLVHSQDFIRHKFLVEMPPDFYAFWQFLEQLHTNKDKPDILLAVENVYQLQLVGPFEFLAGKFEKAKILSPGEYLRHWRFYYDPPEFQTVFVRKGTGIHYGYWRDTPQDKDGLLVARNDSAKGCEIQFVAGNLFEAFHNYLEKDFPTTPFTSGKVINTKKSMQRYVEENKLDLVGLDKLLKERNKKVVCKTFHRAGIVVPFDSKTGVGYRPLIESDAELKRILKLFETNATTGRTADNKPIQVVVKEKLQPIVTAANIAVDECDFGTALELGIDLFCSGREELTALVQTLLVQAYSVLQRPQYIAISKAHLENRSQSLNLSIFK